MPVENNGSTATSSALPERRGPGSTGLQGPHTAELSSCSALQLPPCVAAATLQDVHRALHSVCASRLLTAATSSSHPAAGNISTATQTTAVLAGKGSSPPHLVPRPSGCAWCQHQLGQELSPISDRPASVLLARSSQRT